MLKFVVGVPPESSIVVGDASWKPVVGYETTRAGAVRILVVGLTCALVTAALWLALVPGSLAFGWPSVVWAIAVVVLVPVVHEVLHLLAFPDGGFGKAVAGFWPARGAAYVGYTQPISRNRFLLATVAPVTVLSAGALISAVAGLRIPVVLQWASVLNAFGSGADLLVVYLLIRHSSASAPVLGSGQQLYTRGT